MFSKNSENQKSVYFAEESKNYYSQRGRGRNAIGTQRTLTPPEVQKRLFPQKRGRNAAGAQRTFTHQEVQKTLFPQKEG